MYIWLTLIKVTCQSHLLLWKSNLFSIFIWWYRNIFGLKATFGMKPKIHPTSVILVPTNGINLWISSRLSPSWCASAPKRLSLSSWFYQSIHNHVHETFDSLECLDFSNRDRFGVQRESALTHVSERDFWFTAGNWNDDPKRIQKHTHIHRAHFVVTLLFLFIHLRLMLLYNVAQFF